MARELINQRSLIESETQTLLVFRPGDRVELEGMEVTVLQVCIAANLHVTYEVIWWSGNERKTSWVSTFEVLQTKRKSENLAIGFHNSSTSGTNHH